jgi:hypothetical protein
MHGRVSHISHPSSSKISGRSHKFFEISPNLIFKKKFWLHFVHFDACEPIAAVTYSAVHLLILSAILTVRSAARLVMGISMYIPDAVQR